MTTIVLAAGLSQRMGENKLLLPFKGECILSHTIKRALSFSSRVVVVSGRDREKIEQIALTLGVDMVFNPLFEKGQRESTLCGIRAIENDDFAILPGDLPLKGG